MTTYLLAQIRNFKSCNVCYQASLEVDAVVDAVISIWGDLTVVQATVDHGVAREDLEIINSIISEEDLNCSQEVCKEALIAECYERLAHIPE
jgi:hypothetical protein